MAADLVTNDHRCAPFFQVPCDGQFTARFQVVPLLCKDVGYIRIGVGCFSLRGLLFQKSGVEGSTCVLVKFAQVFVSLASNCGLFAGFLNSSPWCFLGASQGCFKSLGPMESTASTAMCFLLVGEVGTLFDFAMQV